MEPLDTANYYRLGKDQGSQEHRSYAQNRPSYYKVIARWCAQKDAVRSGTQQLQSATAPPISPQANGEGVDSRVSGATDNNADAPSSNTQHLSASCQARLSLSTHTLIWSHWEEANHTGQLDAFKRSALQTYRSQLSDTDHDLLLGSGSQGVIAVVRHLIAVVKQMLAGLACTLGLHTHDRQLA